MDKIKKNAGIKVAIAIIFSVTFLGMLASGLLMYYFWDRGVYEPGGKQQYKEQAIKNVMHEYESTAFDVYSNIYVENCRDIEYKKYYENYFSEENCNYFYKIEPLGDAADKYPTISNYYNDDYNIYYTDYRSVEDYRKDYTFIYEFPDELIQRIKKYHEYPYEDYYEDDTSYTETTVPDYYDVHEEAETYENDLVKNESDVDPEYKKEIDDKFDKLYNDFFIDTGADTKFYINESLCDLSWYFDFREALVKYIEGLDREKYGDWVLLEQSFDDVRMNEYRLTLTGSSMTEFKITSYVKNDLTANDKFLNIFSKYGIYNLIDYIGIIFIVTSILTLLSAVFLINAAGHNEQSDEVKENVLDLIPYDVVILSYIFIASLVFKAFDESMEYVIFASGCVFLLPYLLMTTATRIKVGSLFKNTIISRLIKWSIKVIKKCWNIIKYLYSNVNVYVRYIGIFIAVSLVEFLLVCASCDLGVMGFVWFLEKLAIIFILAVALINMDKLRKGAKEMAYGNLEHKIDTQKMLLGFREHGENLNRIQDGIVIAVNDRLKSERLKTELITNVSHDIKTPLTSIISYVDLLEKENIEGERANEYIEVLDRQSAKLKKLIQDLIDASKASTGNMPVDMTRMELKVLVDQVIGEFEGRFASKNLKINTKYCSDEIAVMADGKLLWRTFDNIFVNIYKYAQENTRVYIDVDCENEIDEESKCIDIKKTVRISFKNISKEELNISGDELMERFVRGDSSRNTEGSGLGLSIAKSLMDIQGGKMEITVDGDLFKVVLSLMRA